MKISMSIAWLAASFNVLVAGIFAGTPAIAEAVDYPIVDTAQTTFFNASSEISTPIEGASFYGQDGQYAGLQPAYTVSGDGLTVYDLVTGLTWTRSHDWNGDGDLDADDKMSQADAEAYAATLSATNYGGYSDWRLPSIKELYSLMDFRGTDPNPAATNTSGLTPFIDSTVFDIGYGDISAGERIIDAQFATTTIYVDTVMNGQEAMFGLNLVDGRIKGYPTAETKKYYAYYCRGNTEYGVNNFLDNHDGTVTDQATGLMWSQADSLTGMDWESALAYAETNALSGYSDWRVPNTKELQSIVDYTRSPDTTASAAIDAIFSATQITNMAGEVDYPWYWTGTTHLNYSGDASSGSYVCFGRGLGTMDGTTIIDVHGAGCQRSDPKTGDPGAYPSAGHGPQGDVRRVFNYVRLVRNVDEDLPQDAQSTGNVLLIIADDLGIDSLAAFNEDPSASLPPTPTIDSLQANGITFTRYYAYSTCSPTRASILTGRYAYRTGVYSPSDNNLKENEFTLPDALIESGMIPDRLAQIGKWHLGNAADSPNTLGGWPHFSGALGGAVTDYYDWSKTVDGATTTGTTTYATTDQVNDAADWIDAQGTNTWFLWLAFNAPHTPMQRPPTDLQSYQPLSASGPNNSRRHFEAMVEAMDTEMARLLTHVDLSETTVIFMGDNGTAGFQIQAPFAQTHAKGTAYEGGIRVPLIISGAAVSNELENTAYDGHLHSVDLYATILDLFGVEINDVTPDELVYDSRSFSAVLRGETYERDPAVIMVNNEFGDSTTRSIMEGDYKLIDYENGTQELYNVTLDLPETNNLLEEGISGEELAAYQSMTNQLQGFINVPQCYTAAMDSNGKFNVEVGWFADADFTLWRTGNLISNEWTEVAGQEIEDTFGAAIILRDPSPPASNAYYRVTTP